MSFFTPQTIVETPTTRSPVHCRDAIAAKQVMYVGTLRSLRCCLLEVSGYLLGIRILPVP